MGKIIKENNKLLTVQKYVKKTRKWINTKEQHSGGKINATKLI